MVSRPVLLICDGCGEVSESVMATTYSLRAARRLAKLHGWTREGKQDYCAVCAARAKR